MSGVRKGPPKHQNKVAWKPNAGIKINETVITALAFHSITTTTTEKPSVSIEKIRVINQLIDQMMMILFAGSWWKI